MHISNCLNPFTQKIAYRIETDNGKPKRNVCTVDRDSILNVFMWSFLRLLRFHICVLMLPATIKWHLSVRQTNFHDCLRLSCSCLIVNVDLNEISKYFLFFFLLFSIKFARNCSIAYANVGGMWKKVERNIFISIWIFYNVNVEQIPSSNFRFSRR